MTKVVGLDPEAWLYALPGAQPAPGGLEMVRNPITEEMHIAAVKVIHRANGVHGLPQRMLDAMLAAAPKAKP